MHNFKSKVSKVYENNKYENWVPYLCCVQCVTEVCVWNKTDKAELQLKLA